VRFVWAAQERGIKNEVRELAQKDGCHADAHNDRASAAFVHHQRHEPAAQAISPGGDHEQKTGGQERQQEVRWPGGKRQSDRDPQHGRKHKKDAEGEMGGNVIDEENLSQHDRQMEQFAQVDGFRALDFHDNSHHPKEEKHTDNAIPNQ
jgi:hypothetical protein